MGKVIISGDFCTLATISSNTEEASYLDDNIDDLWHLKRRYRATNTATNDWLLKINFGSAQSVDGVFINDVNFDKVQIKAHATDATWASAGVYSASIATVFLDERVDRYKAYIPATFNLQWMMIFIPGTAATVGDYKDKWEVGSLVVMDSKTELARNIDYPYNRSAEKPFEDIELPHGGIERVNLGDNLKWTGEMTFGRRGITDEAEVWTVNNYDVGTPLIVYENLSDTSKAYLCLRDDSYQGQLVSNDVVSGNVIKFRELV